MRFHLLKDGTTLALVHARDVGDRPRYWTCSALPPAIDNKRALHTYPNSSAYEQAWVEVAYADAVRADAALRSIYVIGSMRNPRVPEVAKALRSIGWDAFDEWYSSGPEADDKWQEYERARGRSYREAAAGYHARNAFELDKRHLDRCDAAILVMPAGRSAHNEKGYMEGRGKPTYILLDGEPERYDIMPPNFATAVFVSIDEMLEKLK